MGDVVACSAAASAQQLNTTTTTVSPNPSIQPASHPPSIPSTSNWGDTSIIHIEFDGTRGYFTLCVYSTYNHIKHNSMIPTLPRPLPLAHFFFFFDHSLGVYADEEYHNRTIHVSLLDMLFAYHIIQ